MNRFEIRRWFGKLPGLPDDAYRRDTDAILSSLASDRPIGPGGADRLSALLAFALEFSRLDSLSGLLSAEDWDADAAAVLNRGRLRFYRALAENPDSPDSAVLANAAADFRQAADDPVAAYEALGGLLRIQAIETGVSGALRRLRQLEWSGGRAGRSAAAGVRIFLAERPGTPEKRVRAHLRAARRLLLGSAPDMDDELLIAELDFRLGRQDAAVKRLRNWARDGNLEASGMLIREGSIGRIGIEADEWRNRIAEYKHLRPMDPRAFMMEGELLLESDPEAARMAWRGALVLDDRHAPAWGRLGDLYHDAWERGEDDYRNTWLEAAGDAYIKAVSLSPLEGRYRLSLGIVEREAGRPARAVSTIQSALALTSDDPSARRWLALGWADLAYSEDLTPQARSAAAGRAREEWSRLTRGVDRDVFDLIGLARSVILETAGDTGKSASSRSSLDALIRDIVAGAAGEDAGELIALAEDLVRTGNLSDPSELLDRADSFLPGHPRILALRGELAAASQPSEGIRLYLSAAEAAGPNRPETAEWMARAAGIAESAGRPEGGESILRAALQRCPGDAGLQRALALNLHARGRGDEAVASYKDAIAAHPDDHDLLEDAVWFARDADRDDDAGNFLRRALEIHPDDARLFNQLGVHVMETGWDRDSENIGADHLAEAIGAYRKAVELQPENPVYRGNLGDALRQAGQWTEAAELLESALGGEDGTAGDPGEAFAVNSLARLEDERSYAAEGSDSSVDDWDSAGGHYRQAVLLAPENTDFRRDYAWWLYRERNLEEAVDQYRRASAQDPGDETLPLGEASCLRELGEEAKAMDALDRALAIRPDDAEILADKADLHGMLGDTGAAENLFSRVLAVSGNAPWARERLGMFREQQAALAIGEAEYPILGADGRIPDSLPSFAAAGRTRESDHWYGLALQAWESAAGDEPENRELRARMGAACMALGRRDEARELLQASLRHGPEDADALHSLGLLDFDEALAITRRPVGGPGVSSNGPTAGDRIREAALSRLQAAAEAAPLSAEIHAHLGYLHFLGERWLPSLAAFREAGERDPSEAAFAAHAGVAAYLAGEYETAVGFLARGLALRDEAPWRNALGLAYLASGSSALAIDAFRSACLLDPSSDVYPANLALAHESLHVPGRLIQ